MCQSSSAQGSGCFGVGSIEVVGCGATSKQRVAGNNEIGGDNGLEEFVDGICGEDPPARSLGGETGTKGGVRVLGVGLDAVYSTDEGLDGADAAANGFMTDGLEVYPILLVANG